MKAIYHIEPTEIAWLAGLLEGEGYFGFQDNNPCLSVQMVDEDTIRKIAGIFDANYQGYDREGVAQRIYNVSITGRKAVEIMTLVLPYMSMRRTSRIQNIVESWSPKKNHLTDDEVIECFARLMIGEAHKDIATDMGVSRSMISVIDSNGNGKVKRIAESVGASVR